MKTKLNFETFSRLRRNMSEIWLYITVILEFE